MSLDHIPVELRVDPKWVVADGKKRPFNARTGRPATVTNPSDWSSFDAAKQFKNSKANVGRIRHIGFVLSDHDPFTILDIDVKEGESLTDEQKRVLDTFPSYTERSQSERGYHIVIKGKLPNGGIKSQGIEIYSRDHYMIFTGDVARDMPIVDCQKQLDALVAQVRPAPAATPVEDGDEVEGDEAIRAKAHNASNGAKFIALESGESESLGYPSPSEADHAFIGMVAFYSPNDEQVERMVLRSPRGTRILEKKDAKYVKRSLAKIRANQKEVEGIDISPIVEEAMAFVEEARATVEEVQEPEAPQAAPECPPGLVGRLAAYFYESAIRQVPEVALASAIGFTAGIAGRQWNIAGEPAGLNLYVILLGLTGIGKEGGKDGIARIVSAVKEQGHVPLVLQFEGPTAFASGPALIKRLAKQPCFYSQLGEFGHTLRRIAGDGATSAEQSLKRVLLDIYSRSGRDKSVGVSAYSEEEKNTVNVMAPAVTIIGESTPDVFFDSLNESQVSDGLVPRLLVIQYKGGRPPRNRLAGRPPDSDLVRDVAELVAISLKFERENTFVQVTQTPEAQAILDQFDADVDAKMDAAGANDNQRQLWNRAHLMALKLSTLVAVGCHPGYPVVDVVHARWAIALVERSVMTVLGQFKSGHVGGNVESRAEEDMRRAIKKFLDMTPEERTKDTRIPQSMRNQGKEKFIPYAFLAKNTQQLAAFKRRPGMVDSTLKGMVKSGLLSPVLDRNIRASLKVRPTTEVYTLGENWRKS
jgi:hypothetical protein